MRYAKRDIPQCASFKWKGESFWLTKKRKKNVYVLVATVNGKNESIHEIVKKEKGICVNFAVPSQTAKVIATVHGKCLFS